MSKYKEASFPSTYRERQVREIMSTVAHRRSIAAFGLAGMGKSNLFRFIMAQPRVAAQYLGRNAPRCIFVYVNCNLSESMTQEGLLGELDEQFARAGLIPPPATVGTRLWSQRRSIQLRLEQVDPEQVVVVILDPLDEVFRSVEPRFWAYLRGLRDLQGNVAFVLGARRPPPPLPEFQELLAEACWVTPLIPEDAYASLARDETRLGVSLPEQDKADLVTLSGGHPGLLKNAAEITARSKPGLNVSMLSRLSELAANETIQEVCRDLWGDLRPEERQILEWICFKGKGGAPDRQALAFLHQVGLVQTLNETLVIFSPLFEAYIKTRVERVVRLRIEMENRVQIESWQGAQTLRLNEGPYHLLRAMALAPDQTHSHAQLSRILYSGDPDYSREALAAHIKRLRQTLNEAIGQIIQVPQFNAILSEPKMGYRLNLGTREDWRVEYHVTS